MRLEHYRSNRTSAIQGIVWTVVIILLLCVLPAFLFRDLMIIPFILMALAIFSPVMILGVVRHLNKEGGFRSWLSEETIGQDLPFEEEWGVKSWGVKSWGVKSFEAKVSEIGELQKIDPGGDGSTRWVLSMTDGRSFQLCDRYGNPVQKYFKELVQLRPELKITRK